MRAPSDITVLHGTSTAALDFILRDGIKPRGGIGADAWARKHAPADISQYFDARPPMVYLASARDPDTAEKYAQFAADVTGSDPVVIAVHIPPEGFKTFELDTGGDAMAVRRMEAIPASWIGDYTVIPRDMHKARADLPAWGQE